MPPSLLKISLWLHILIETPASLNFFLNPSQQLHPSTPAPAAAAAEALIRQYALLLLSSNLIALIFAVRPVDRTSRRVAGALGLYHAGPIVRAASRLLHGEAFFNGGFGGPATHLGVHVACFLALLGSWMPSVLS
jgi:hypothetical protein